MPIRGSLTDFSRSVPRICRAAACCCAVLLATNTSYASEFFDVPAITIPSSVTLEGNGDALGSRDFTVSTDVDLQSGNRIRAGYTSARVETESYNTVSDIYSIGLNSDPLSTWSYGMSYETMERDDKFASDTVRGNIKWRLPQWRFALYPELRYLTLVDARSGLRLGVRNPALGVAVTFNGLNAWSFTLKRFVYQYTNNAETLSRLPVLRRRVSTRIGQEFNESQTGLRVDYAQSRGGASLEWTRSISALDQLESRDISLSAYWDVSRTWSLFLRYGRSSGANLDPVDFSGGGVTFLWGDAL